MKTWGCELLLYLFPTGFCFIVQYTIYFLIVTDKTDKIIGLTFQKNNLWTINAFWLYVVSSFPFLLPVVLSLITVGWVINDLG